MAADTDRVTTQAGQRAGNGAGGHPSAPVALAPAAPAPVVLAIGAPAAETGSLVRVLTELPPDAGLAVILALQHGEVFDEAAFREALGARAGALAAAADGTAVEAGRIYLPGPDPVVAVEGGRFRTRPAGRGPEGRGPEGRGTIDGLFVSLAADQDGHTIGLLLAGTGGDGALGLAAVKEAGGLTLADAAGDASRDGLTALSGPAALADLALPAGEIAERIALHARQLARLQQAAAEVPATEAATGELAADAAVDAPAAAAASGALDRIAAVLLERTGHDFHGYKRPTFLRRVQRRMQVAGADTFDAYLDALHDQPDEAQLLFNDLLIGVTRFFRDPREFEFIEREVVPELFAGKGRGDHVRVWVLGCSTGEEAYSIAILLREYAAKLAAPPGVQILATDLDGHALAVARAGRYPASIAEDVSPERLARWFVEEGKTYAVTRGLRDACVFSQHSLIKDTPFTRLDLVSCRNLLIYLGPDLQDRVIPLFHFALRPGGYLFLGTSEGVARHTKLFAPVGRGVRVFRKVETGRRVLPDFPAPSALPRTGSGLAPQVRLRPPDPGMVRRAARLAERHAPAYVVVDEAYDVLHFSPRAGRYVHPADGAPSLNLIDLVHADLRLHLRGALGEAARERHSARADRVPMNAEGRRSAVDIVVEPDLDDAGAARGFVVLLSDGPVPPEPGKGPAADAPNVSSEHVRRLEAELRLTRQRLQATIEELEGANEELRASNEEYQSLNEELQSANEELATSKEELQSLNEELTTVNHELAHRVDELGRVNSDLKNLQQATQIATVFLDVELRVTNFTPAAAEVFHLVEADLGRPIAHIKSRVAYDGLQEDARRVLRTLGAVEREVEEPGAGARYIARMLPYRSVDNVIAGVVLTFSDVTELRRLNDTLERRVEARTGELMAAEASLRQSQKMEAVGQLTGGIAHDFNNMLQAISGGLELMRIRLEHGRATEAVRLAEAVRETVGRAASLTHRLLVFSRRQQLQARPVALDALVEGVAELIRRTVGPGVAVELRLGDGNWPVLCDPHQLESALLNLAINARDAMPQGGQITIATVGVRLGAADVAGQDGAEPGDYVEVAVADTGSGMDEATKAHAFEPFFTTKPIGQGTGLGLSQLYGFVRQSDGVVRLDSAPGQGTTVRLYLPRHREPAGAAASGAETPAPRAAGPVAPARSGTTVLLVDDEAGVRAVAAEHLRELGYEVLEAGDGPAALRVLHGSRGFRVDALVTDVGLPNGLNGRQLAEAARERRPGLPVLFITGYAGNVLEQHLAPGMEVIGKPFALDALAARIRSMVEGEGSAQP